MYQDLSKFRMPDGFRGKSSIYVQMWWIVDALFFRNSPQFAYGFRAFLLRLFGARIGRGSVIRPTVRVTYPWKLSVGDNVWVGDDVVLYSLGKISIGCNSVVSQRSYICSADHDMFDDAFAIRARDVNIEDEAWIASDVFVGPGVNIGRGCVVGARSSVFSNMPSGMICKGSPCKPYKSRDLPHKRSI